MDSSNCKFKSMLRGPTVAAVARFEPGTFCLLGQDLYHWATTGPFKFLLNPNVETNCNQIKRYRHFIVIDSFQIVLKYIASLEIHNQISEDLGKIPEHKMSLNIMRTLHQLFDLNTQYNFCTENLINVKKCLSKMEWNEKYIDRSFHPK